MVERFSLLGQHEKSLCWRRSTGGKHLIKSPEELGGGEEKWRGFQSTAAEGMFLPPPSVVRHQGIRAPRAALCGLLPLWFTLDQLQRNRLSVLSQNAPAKQIWLSVKSAVIVPTRWSKNKEEEETIAPEKKERGFSGG